jgi:uncharacterized RDD family membrane protein YckC
LIQVFYFSIFEWAYGATIGKMILQLRVVREDGTPGGLWTVFLRSLLRYVDGLFFGIPAAMSMCHNYNQRIGDRVAKTFVVSSRDPDIKKKRSGYFLLLAVPGYLLIDFVLIVILLLLLLQIKTLTI